MAIDMEKLYRVKVKEMSKGLYRWIHAMTKKSGDHTGPLLISCACTLILLCRHYNADPRRVMDTTDRVLRNAQDIRPKEFRAMRAYMKGELPK